MMFKFGVCPRGSETELERKMTFCASDAENWKIGKGGGFQLQNRQRLRPVELSLSVFSDPVQGKFKINKMM